MTKKRHTRIKWKNVFLAIALLVVLVGGIFFTISKVEKEPSKDPDIKEPSDKPDENEPNDPNGEENPGNVPKPTKSYVGTITKASSFTSSVDPKLEEVLVSFMDTYFAAMKDLKESDMTTYFAKDAYEQAYVHQTALGIMIGTRKLEKNDMKLSSAKYDIVYTNMKTSGNQITLSFLESDTLHFNFMKNIESKVLNIENTFVFEKTGDTYELLSVDKVQDFYVMVTNEYHTGKSESTAKSTLDSMKENYLEDYQKQRNNWDNYRANYLEGKDAPTIVCDHAYNREEAKAYADKYIIDRNPDIQKYDDWGGNCQNYASQVVHAGGVPMDTVGDQKWKHYSTGQDYTSAQKGRTNSWTTVPDFYDYAKNNTGYGLCSQANSNPYYAEAGDVGQVGFGGKFRHTVVVSGTVKDESGKTIDILLHSNTVDLENFPISAYAYPNKRIIKILGWND